MDSGENGNGHVVQGKHTHWAELNQDDHVKVQELLAKVKANIAESSRFAVGEKLTPEIRAKLAENIQATLGRIGVDGGVSGPIRTVWETWSWWKRIVWWLRGWHRERLWVKRARATDFARDVSQAAVVASGGVYDVDVFLAVEGVVDEAYPIPWWGQPNPREVLVVNTTVVPKAPVDHVVLNLSTDPLEFGAE